MIDRSVRDRVIKKIDILIKQGIASEEEIILRKVLDYENSDRYIEDFLNDNTDFRVMIAKM